MATITLHRDRLHHNYDWLTQQFESNGIEWGVVTKLLCGNTTFLCEIVDLGTREIHDSRIRNLKVVKGIDPDIQTVYIKPPPKRSVKSVIRYADVSFNTEYETMKMLSEEAVRQGKTHKVIIMIEMGDLREGVLGDRIVDFYKSVADLPNLDIVGLGTNLNCLHGVMPSHDKLIQLSLYKQLIEAHIGKPIPWASGGTSVTVPLLLKKLCPAGINHFRIGEMLFFGLDLFTMETIEGLYDDVLVLDAEIIELNEKPKVPVGELAQDPSGDVHEINEDDYGKTSYRAILDIGLLDVNPDYLIPADEGITFSGASSDMIVMDLGDSDHGFKVGDLMRFKLRYMGALSLMNSDYIDKVVYSKPG